MSEITLNSDRKPSIIERQGEVDIGAVGALLSDPGRCHMLLALDDGRSLPASLLAAVAGVTPATASSHWSEQRHHLSGTLGRALLTRLAELDWIRRSKVDRAVILTPAGVNALAEHFNLDWPPSTSGN